MVDFPCHVSFFFLRRVCEWRKDRCGKIQLKYPLANVPFWVRYNYSTMLKKMGRDPPNCKQTLKQIENTLLIICLLLIVRLFLLFLLYPHVISANLWGLLDTQSRHINHKNPRQSAPLVSDFRCLLRALQSRFSFRELPSSLIPSYAKRGAYAVTTRWLNH